MTYNVFSGTLNPAQSNKQLKGSDDEEVKGNGGTE